MCVVCGNMSTGWIRAHSVARSEDGRQFGGQRGWIAGHVDHRGRARLVKERLQHARGTACARRIDDADVPVSAFDLAQRIFNR